MEYGFRIEVREDDLFVEEITAENIADYKVKDIKFFDKQGNCISKDEAVILLTDYIKKMDEEFRMELEMEDNGRERNGRFLKGNTNANKLVISMEEVYLLYRLCGTMEKTASALGVCRQTISKSVNWYKCYLDKQRSIGF